MYFAVQTKCLRNDISIKHLHKLAILFLEQLAFLHVLSDKKKTRSRELWFTLNNPHGVSNSTFCISENRDESININLRSNHSSISINKKIATIRRRFLTLPSHRQDDILDKKSLFILLSSGKSWSESLRGREASSHVGAT